MQIPLWSSLLYMNSPPRPAPTGSPAAPTYTPLCNTDAPGASHGGSYAHSKSCRKSMITTQVKEEQGLGGTGPFTTMLISTLSPLLSLTLRHLSSCHIQQPDVLTAVTPSILLPPSAVTPQFLNSFPFSPHIDQPCHPTGVSPC